MDKAKVACLFAGIDQNRLDTMSIGETCPICGNAIMKRFDPLHNDGDYWRLVKGMMGHEGYRQFEEFADNEYLTEFVPPIEVFTAWLLLDPARFISLIWDWTGLEEVQEKYGMTECPTCWKPGDYTGALPVFCPTCNGSGKVPAPWLKERRKGCQG